MPYVMLGAQCQSGPGVFCLLFGVSQGCARPITGQVTSVTWPVIGWAQSEFTPSKRQKQALDMSSHQCAIFHWQFLSHLIRTMRYLARWSRQGFWPLLKFEWKHIFQWINLWNDQSFCYYRNIKSLDTYRSRKSFILSPFSSCGTISCNLTSQSDIRSV